MEEQSLVALILGMGMSYIRFDKIVKYYGDKLALDELSFEVGRGQVHGLLGLNGAGKTTLMSIFAACLAPDNGEIFWEDRKLSSDRIFFKKNIGFLPETPPLYPDMKVYDYLHFVAELNGVPRGEIKANIGNAIDKLQLHKQASRLIGNLSKGLKQRVGVAQTLVYNPPLIMLDEPTVGLDPSSILDMRNLIKDLKKDHTVIFSSHLLHEVSLVCTHLSLIHEGKLLFTGEQEKMTATLGHQKHMELLIQGDDFPAQEVLLRDISCVAECQFLGEENQLGRFYLTLDDRKVNENEEADVRYILLKDLIDNGFKPVSLYSPKESLEKVFFQLTDADWSNHEENI